MTQKRARRTFTKEFKGQMVQLFENGKPRADIIREYDLTASAFDKWVKQTQSSGSFSEKDNRTPEEAELIKLRKENQRLMMENDIFKASRADYGTKVDVIRSNRHKYSVSAMCDVLTIPRSTFYYEPIEKPPEDELVEQIRSIFISSRSNYGTRKIKVELEKLGFVVSRRRIGRTMREQGLVSNYTVAQFKPFKEKCNEEPVKNVLNRKFNDQEELAVVVSDLTYVRVNGKWNYVCLFVDLFNREIIGHSAGPNKTAELVYKALSSIDRRLDDIQIFHTDRGNEFKNKLIDRALKTFGIERSLSMKGCPYDNAVAEAMFKVFKTEFANGAHFESLDQLLLELRDYVNWFNKFRIHGTLDYKSPVEYRLQTL
ncbi:IS3 family transposase [Bacillus sp. FSL K6-3431]|uniref:IS3 family transposase n=1 Tax=Bacillus sp. FSL K6-3431 TaxID=2921500 RepID=UPI0030FA990F